MHDTDGDDDDVVALEQRTGRRVAHAVDLLVDRRFLLDVGVGARDVGLRLVVVVVGDEILDRIVREERLELAVELGGERLVGGEDERRALGLLDDLGDGVGLAGAGHPEKHLIALLLSDAGNQLGDRRWLVALGLELGDDAQRHPALGLFRARRPMRHPGLVAELGPAALDQRRQGLDGGGDRGRREVGDVLEVHVDARHRVHADGGALLGRAEPAHGRATGAPKTLFFPGPAFGRPRLLQGLLGGLGKSGLLRGSHGLKYGGSRGEWRG